MTKKKIILIVLGAFLANFLIVATATMIFYHFFDGGNLPMDDIANEYLYANEEFIQEYGEIKTIYRYTRNQHVEDNYAKIEYMVHNHSQQEIQVWLEFEKSADTWVVTNMELIQVVEIEADER